MRVIAGRARSMPLKTPPGMDTRPTTDRIKETLFNILQSQIPGCVFVDVFSGSGGIGIEALSRGASRAYFIENSPRAAACIQENLVFTKFTDRAIVLKQDALAALPAIREREADIVFLDPPYGQGLEREALSVLSRMPYVTENTLLVAEARREESFDFVRECSLKVVREKLYKTNKHVFITK